jgi:hypothetical protein
VEVFCSYAHQDEAFVHALKAHLSSLLRQRAISFWYDRLLPPGADWACEIDEQLNRASLILLLISADFLASDYCYGVEMARALARHTAREARIVPVLVRAVDWQDEPVADLQALPAGARPIASWENRDEALADVARGLRQVIAELAAFSVDTPSLEHTLPTQSFLHRTRGPARSSERAVAQRAERSDRPGDQRPWRCGQNPASG